MQLTTLGGNISLWPRRLLTLAFAGFLVLALTPRSLILGQQLAQPTSIQEAKTPEQLQQLVAPIALYPDALVAQILAAATYPTEVVQADRFVQQHSYLQGGDLAAAADRQSWDPSVKALTAFPSVLANLDKNLSWTEALGDAYFNQQQDVLDAVQVMRQRAEAAGNLQSTPQERVSYEGATILIEPAYSDVCYLPIYDPWIVYGAAIAVYPGYLYDPWYGAPFISFGPAIGLGFFGGFNWGWPAWGFNWGRRVIVFNRNTYVSRSRYFFNRGPSSARRAVAQPRPSLPSVRGGRSFNNGAGFPRGTQVGNGSANRGPAPLRSNTGSRSGAFNSARSSGTNRDSISRGTGAGRPGSGNVARPSLGRQGRSGFSSGARSNSGGGPRGGGSRGGNAGRRR